MSLNDLIQKIRNSGLEISLNGENLDLRYGGTEPDQDLLLEIKRNKSDLITFLQKKSRKSNYEKIPKAPQQELYDLSHAQKRLWVLDNLNGSSVEYNIPAAILIKEKINFKALESAIAAIIDRYESLRTIFIEKEGEVKQKILNKDEVKLNIKFSDYSNEKKTKEDLKTELNSFSKEQFNLGLGPLYKARLIRLEENEYALFFLIHHIIADGWSLEIFLKELFRDYLKFLDGEIVKVEPLFIQYKDYANWFNKEISEGVYSESELYWKSELKDLNRSSLITDKSRPEIHSFNGKSVSIGLDKELSKAVKEFSNKVSSSSFTTYLFAINLLLRRYCNEKEIVVGSPVNGRFHKDLEAQIGFFVNTVIIKNEVDLNISVRGALQLFQNKLNGILKHQDYPFDLLIEKGIIKKDTKQNAPFDIMFVYNSFELTGSEKIPFKHENLLDTYDVSKFDLEIIVNDTNKGSTEVKFLYNEDIFFERTIERVAANFLEIMKSLLKIELNLPVSAVNFIEDKERNLLKSFHQNTIEIPEENNIVEIFEDVAETYADNTALIFNEKKYCYRELNEESNRLANFLKLKYEISTGDCIAILSERDEWAVISQLAILKLGAAFLPIDPKNPASRISYFIENSNTKLTIINAELNVIKLGFNEMNSVKLSLIKKELRRSNSKNLNTKIKKNDLAYIIYTSGSTGKPKGTALEHLSLINFIKSKTKILTIKKDDRFLHFTSFVFDVSMFETFASLLNGASLYLLSDEERRLPDFIEDYVIKNEISIITLPPVFAQNIDFTLFTKVRIVVIGGERFKKEVLTNKNIRYINAYGPTEATVFATLYEFSEKDKTNNRVSIGKSIDNLNIYLLSEDKKEVPVGAIGELAISGLGLAREYINNAEITAEKFIKNPFSDLPGLSRIYLTGDLAYYAEDGNIYFLGRKDDQVKIRGYRIELGEIESLIRSSFAITDVVVQVISTLSDEKQLVAYIKCRELIEENKIREFLAENIPDYMIPAFFVFLDEFPVNASGKIDKKKLPVPNISNQRFIDVSNDTEKRLRGIWAMILGISEESISTDMKFFDIGGNSINAIKVRSTIHKTFNVDLKLNDIFTSISIKELANLISNKKKITYSEIPVAEVREYYPLSAAQERMFILHQITGESAGYNMTFALRFQGMFNKTKVEGVLLQLLKRHSPLRTYFKNVDDKPVQYISNQYEINIEYEKSDLSQLKSIVKKFVRPFDLMNGPFLRIKHVELNENDHVLIFDLCHIFSDGTTIKILLDDFLALYQERNLSSPRVDYKDFALWQKQRFDTGDTREQERFWLKQFEGDIPVLDLPSDFTRPAIQSFDGKTIYFELNNELTNELRKLARATDTTLYMILLSVFKILLSRHSGQEDILVGSPAVGRTHPDLENMVGLFLNTVVLRTKVGGELLYTDYLRELKKVCINAFDNQEYPFEELIDKLQLKRDISRNPLFDCMFNLLNIDNVDVPSYRNNDLNIEAFELYEDNTKFDLYFNAYESKDEIRFALGYAVKLFREDTILRFVEEFRTLLIDIIKKPEQRIADLNILPEKEKQQIKVRFNKNDFDIELKTIHQLFEKNLDQVKNKTALVYQDKAISYEELNKNANRLANYLREEFNVSVGDFVGLCCDRNPDMIISVLAIIKAGAAYVAIDPTYPKDRVTHMLVDSATKLLLSDRNREELYKNYQNPVLNLNESKELLSKYSSVNPAHINHVDDPMYVVYTSGSTGTPNGAILSHSILHNLLQWQKDVAGIEGGLRCLQFTSLNFCVSFQEIFSTLITGGSLYLIDEIERRDINYLMSFLSKNEIEALYLPFSYLNFLFNEYEKWGTEFKHSLKHIITAGEQLKISPGLKSFMELNPNIRLHNHYGSSEIHVVTSYTMNSKNLMDYDMPPVGRPIANTKIYILDTEMNLCPIGVFGDIYIEGAGAMLGYINNEDLTKQKFIPSTIHEGKQFYKTGDIGRWLSDGNIEYKGRRDKQLKIRGFRIEPGEIETLIMSVNGVENCVIVDKEDHQKQKYLVAYIVVSKEFIQNDLENILTKRFPSYMVPKIQVLESIPLMPNGKVDRDALPEPGLDKQQGVNRTEAKTETEKLITEIWKTVLSVDNVYVNQDFFELGGHSLRASQVISALKQKCCVTISLMDFFQNTTIFKLGALVDRSEKIKPDQIKKLDRVEYYSISNAQKRLWFLSQFRDIASAYNMCSVFSLNGKLIIEHLEEAINSVIIKHEILRTTFHEINGEVKQKINEFCKIQIEFEDAKNLSKNDILDKILEKKKVAFNLTKLPLLKFGLYQLNHNEYLFYCIMDHILADAWSLKVLFSEITRNYNNLLLMQELDLSIPAVQYKEYCYWLNDKLIGGELDKQKNYWLEQFSDSIPALNLQTDFPRPELFSYKGKSIYKSFDTIMNNIQVILREKQISLFMYLLSALNILLYKYSKCTDIVIGSPIAGREHKDLENQIGFYLNTLAFRTKFKKEESVNELLDKNKTIILNAFQNQAYPFDELINELKIERKDDRQQLFDIMLVLQNTNISEYSDFSIRGLKVETIELDSNVSKYDLMFLISEVNDSLNITLEYCTSLFKEERAKLILERFAKILTLMSEDTRTEIETICDRIDMSSIEGQETVNFELNF